MLKPIKYIILFITLFIFSNSLHASHAAGGEIWYSHIADSTYKVHFRFYRDCTGSGASSSISLAYRSLSLGITNNVSLPRDTFYQNNTCAENTCNNYSSAYLGIEVHEYSGDLTFSPASDWEMEVAISGRNASDNLLGIQLFYVRATLNNLLVHNNSSFPFAPINLRLGATQQTLFNFPLSDPDYDSLWIEFSPCFTRTSPFNMQPLAFIGGSTVLNPFNSSVPPALNHNNGAIILYPGLQGNYSFAILIKEYKNNQLVGTSMRDYLFSLEEGNNILPYLLGIDSTNNFDTTVIVCPNQNINFTIPSGDSNITDSTFLFCLNKPSSSIFTITPGQNEIATFDWTPGWQDAKPIPHVITVKVKDNQCTEQTYGYRIMVDTCKSVSVEDINQIQSVILFPNPVNNNSTLFMNLKESVNFEMKVYDFLGRSAPFQLPSRVFSAGHHQLQVPVQLLARGSYILVLRYISGVKTIPFIKE